ncbi:MAG: sigma-70 family RNA polymerase sigma factor [bacterium]
MTETDDIELMLRVKGGDEEAFRLIVERYHRSIFNLCYRYVESQEDAEEVAQDVFIKVYKTAPLYEPRAKLSTYFYRIAVNLSLNKIRDRKRKRFLSLDQLQNSGEKDRITSDGFDPDILAEQQERQRLIRQAIDSLPQNQRTAVILRRFEELSYEEIAEVMKCSVSAVEARLHRAKQSLKKKLKPIFR